MSYSASMRGSLNAPLAKYPFTTHSTARGGPPGMRRRLRASQPHQFLCILRSRCNTTALLLLPRAHIFCQNARYHKCLNFIPDSRSSPRMTPDAVTVHRVLWARSRRPSHFCFPYTTAAKYFEAKGVKTSLFFPIQMSCQITLDFLRNSSNFLTNLLFWHNCRSAEKLQSVPKRQHLS